MTTTPESWDDIGCLRLEVNSIFERMEDVQQGQHSHCLDVSQLQAVTQELKAEVALLQQEQKKEVCRMKVCIIITLVLFAIITLALLRALQTCTMYTGSASGLTWWSMINHPEDPRGPHGDRHSHETPVIDDIAKRKVEKELLAEQRTEQTMSGRKRWTEAQMAANEAKKNKYPGEAKKKPSTSWKVVDKKEPEAKQTPEREALQSSTDSEQHAEPGATGAQEDRENDRQDAKETGDKDSEEREGRQDKFSEQPGDELGDKISLPQPLPFQNTNLKTSEEGEDHEDSNQIREEPGDKISPPQPLPFQRLNPVAEERMQSSRDGVFWVCFPPHVLDESVKKYASVFNEVARSQRWRMYEFSYLDSGRLQVFTDHFCDVMEITFVLEKISAVDSGSKHTPLWRAATKRETESPAWFKRTFPKDQDIQVSLVEHFLNDIHSGTLPEIKKFKGDL